MSTEIDSSSLDLLIRKKPGKGDTQESVRRSGSEFQKLLAAEDKKTQFFYFFVDPRSIAVFRAAREEAAKAGFAVGWDPLGSDEPARIVMAGSGGSAPTHQ